MKLNPDCIRDILLTVELETDLKSHFLFYNESHPCCDKHNDYELLKKYSIDEVLYHLKQCELSNLLFNVKWYKDDSCSVSFLSPTGHEFLANVRADSIWNDVKSVASKIGSISLDVLVKISTGILNQIINKQLGY